MTYDEKWSYTFAQIEEYVLSCGAVSDGSVYSLEDCEIILEALPDRPLGHLVFPQTRIRITGPGAEKFYHGFYLRFLSGGA